MRYSAQHKERTRQKILDAAARLFRADGYDGLGIDGLVREAGVTNGAFYGHFASKGDAFREIAVQGLIDLRAGVERFQAERGEAWLADLARFYFSAPKIDCAEQLCALPGFAPEMARAPRETRDAFEREMARVAESLAGGLSGDRPEERLDRAWIILSLFSGGIALLRSIGDPARRAALAASLAAEVAAKA